MLSSHTLVANASVHFLCVELCTTEAKQSFVFALQL